MAPRETGRHHRRSPTGPNAYLPAAIDGAPSAQSWRPGAKKSMSTVSSGQWNSCGTLGGMTMIVPAFIVKRRPWEKTSQRPETIQVICSFE
ncbi:hypothetical protein C8J43_11239 [Sphingomonas sp. PP-CE-1G-424]|nr:hypothetical protein C8J43_11239 [Sphingomonas sp. PP-CE-1G-424]